MLLESEFGPGSEGWSGSEVDSDDEGSLDSVEESNIEEDSDIEKESDEEWERESNETLPNHNREWKNACQEPISTVTIPIRQDLQLSEALFQLSMIFWTF